MAGRAEDKLLKPEDPLQQELAKVEQPKVSVSGSRFPGVQIKIGHLTRMFHATLTRVQLLATPEKTALITLGL